MKRLRPIFAAAAATLCTGCVLADPADVYPWEGPLLVIDLDSGTDPGDTDPEEDVDAGDPGTPVLIFTELLIDVSSQQSVLGEYGEYIEIKNIGDGPADPQRIVMLLSEPDNPGGLRDRIQVALPATEEERQAVEALEMIEPGDYFVFVRFESDVAPISQMVPASNRYDYGRFASGPSLPNFVDRRLELTYADERTPEPFDVVRWDRGALIAPDGGGEGVIFSEDVSVTLDAAAEDAAANDDPKKWCLSTEPIEGGTALGTPGLPGMCEPQ